MANDPKAPDLVKGFFDVVEDGPAAIPEVVANIVVPGAGLLFSKKVRDALGEAVKPKNYREEEEKEE